RGYGDHDDAGHHEAPPERFLEPQLRDPHLRRAHQRLIRDEERPEVLVVRREETVDGDGPERRSREREHHRTKETERRGPVDPGRVPELARDLEERLPQQERAERRRQERDGETLIRVEPTEGADRHVVRDDRGLPRDHERAEVREEQQRATAEYEERE